LHNFFKLIALKNIFIGDKKVIFDLKDKIYSLSHPIKETK